MKLSLQDRYIEKYPEIGPAFLEALNYADGMPKVTWASQFEKAMDMAYEEVMYGKKDAKEALEDAYSWIMREIGNR